MTYEIYSSPGVLQSSLYTATISGAPLHVFGVSNIPAFYSTVWTSTETVEQSWVCYGSDSTTELVISAENVIASAKVYPKNVATQNIVGGSLILNVPTNTRLRVEIDGDRANPLYVFSSPLQPTVTPGYTSWTSLSKTVSNIDVITGIWTTSTSHGLSTGDKIVVASTGSMPQLSNSVMSPVELYTVSVINSTQFRLETTEEGIIGVGSGTITLHKASHTFGSLYFPTGYHTIGRLFRIGAGDHSPDLEVFIDGGAVVRGSFDIRESQDVRFRGRGVIDGSYATRQQAIQSPDHTLYHVFNGEDGNTFTYNNSVEGLTIVNYPLFLSNQGVYRWANCHAISPWNFNTDGFSCSEHPSITPSIVANCFAFCGDDALTFGDQWFSRTCSGSFITVSNGSCVLLSYFSNENEGKEAIIQDCDFMTFALADGPSPPGYGQSDGANAIVKCWVDGYTGQENYGQFNTTITGSRIWGPLDTRLFSIENKIYPFSTFLERDGRGQVADWLVYDVTCEDLPLQKSRIYGLDSINTPHDLTFGDISIKSTQVTSGNWDEYFEYNRWPYNILIDFISISEAAGELTVAYTPISYSYNLQEINIRNISMSYSYGDSNQSVITAPLVGYRAAQTQQILNNLPQWTKARQDQTSNSWKLINSWAMNVEQLLAQITEKVSDINVVTTNVDKLHNLYYTDITSKEVLENKAPRNLLFNSSFSMKDCSRVKLPSGWIEFDTYPPVQYTNCTAAVGSRGLASSSGLIKIGQQVILDNIQVGKLTASVYVLSKQGTTSVRLLVSVEKIDGTSLVSSAILTSNNTEWTRLVLPIEINSNVYKVHYSIIANCSNSVSISNPQLEVGSVTNWSKSINDYLPYYPNFDNFNTVFATTIENNTNTIPLFGIPDEDQFIDVSIPTRVSKVSKPNIDLSPLTSQAYGRKVSQLGEIVRTEYVVIDNKIVERSVAPSVWDIFNRYDIKELRYYEDLTYGKKDNSLLSIVPLATCIRKEYLFIACKETIHNNTYRTLKIVRPVTPPNGESYLESFIDFDLNLNFDSFYSEEQISEEEIALVSFSEIEPSYLVITSTANKKYYYKLYFDYYHFKEAKNRLYTIEYYGPNNLTIL